MAGIDFDRKAFVPAAEPAPRPQARVLGSLLLVIGLAALGFLGFKLLADSRQSAAAATNSQSLDALQQQLTKMEKRLEQLERRRKVSPQESDAPPSNSSAKAPAEKSAPTKTVYTVVPANGSKAQTPPVPLSEPPALPSRTPSPSPSANQTATADREAWQATTDRLADVVGVVGSQEGRKPAAPPCNLTCIAGRPVNPSVPYPWCSRVPTPGASAIRYACISKTNALSSRTVPWMKSSFLSSPAIPRRSDWLRPRFSATKL